MPMHKPHQTARRLAPTRNPLPLSIKALICAALIVVFGASAATPAGADPSPGGGDAHPFGGLSCSCSDTAPAGSPALRQQIAQGIQQALSDGHGDQNLVPSQ